MQETQETWVRSLAWEDTLEVEMATHSSVLAWKIPWTEEPGRLQSMGWKELDMIEHACAYTHIHTQNYKLIQIQLLMKIKFLWLGSSM